MLETIHLQRPDFRRRLWREAMPVAGLTLALGLAAAVLAPFGSPYLQIFAMNVSMVTFALTVVMFHRYRDWRILPLCLLYFWHTLELTCAGWIKVLTVSPPPWILWLVNHPLLVPSLLGFAVVVYLWRVFQVQASLQQREDQLADRIRQGQKLESLGIMAGGIAHDFSNLLTAIIGNASLLKMDAEEGSETMLLADRILASAERAGDISRQMLDYSGCGKLTVKEMTMQALVEKRRQLIESFVPARITLTIDHAPGEIATFAGDASQLGQVLINLVTNAAEAIPDRGVITIWTGRIDADEVMLARGANSDLLPPGSYAVLHVEDDGEGMNPETREHMFDPFFSTKTVGRGMGLAAALGIVRGHHGTILVESEPGQGTSLKVLLPAVPPAKETRQAPLPPHYHDETEITMRTTP